MVRPTCIGLKVLRDIKKLFCCSSFSVFLIDIRDILSYWSLSTVQTEIYCSVFDYFGLSHYYYFYRYCMRREGMKYRGKVLESILFSVYYTGCISVVSPFSSFRSLEEL